MTYRFETLLRLRKNEENHLQRTMALIRNHLFSQQENLQDLQKNYSQASRNFDERFQKPSDGRTLTLFNDYFQALKSQTVQQSTVIDETSEKVKAKQSELIEAVRKRRTLEILKERQVLEAKAKQKKVETALMDEIAQNLWRNKNKITGIS